MKTLKHIFDKNQAWAMKLREDQPEIFSRLSKDQQPEYLWIGCSDSRVPANEICGLDPGEMFVHRNIANMVVHTDLNCLSVIQFAIDVLKIKNIIVCGHYGCGGVKTAYQGDSLGLIDNWLANIKDVIAKSQPELKSLKDPQAQVDRICELNVAQQVQNLCSTTIVQNAWKRGQELSVHGWIYNMKDGLLHDLGLCFSSPAQIAETFQLNL
ncbi:MAG: carbonate dehydratase [Pseudobdellovibrionaceae bacterium]|nr:carbonate dehydratase [Bdellovibrionales bacterium]USN48966.1 MAG: carbonate dehydratase [Pseudobdellovibrionaceae bacterium]